MTLIIQQTHLQKIYTCAESDYPQECCGILLGTIVGDTKTVIEVIPTANIWEPEDVIDRFTRNRNSRYAIPPQDILNAQKRGRNLGLEIVGFFHSHPDNPAIPSSCDRDLAWEVYSYPIVSIEGGKVANIESWVLDENRIFQREPIQQFELEPIAIEGDLCSSTAFASVKTALQD